MPRRALYQDLAKYYDQIYHWKDYRKETGTIKELIQKYKRSSGRSLLDVACGTGKHILYLSDNFDCTGVDISRQMVAMAKKNVPGVRFVRGDMVDFDLGRKFDVVLCLFSSMGYLLTRSSIRKAVANLAKHMNEGGVLIVEPWIRKSKWKDKTVHIQTYSTDPLIITRVDYGSTSGDYSFLDERYLIAQKGKGIAYVVDRHKLRFFEPKFTLDAMRRVGLQAEFTEASLMPGRGLIIATKVR